MTPAQLHWFDLTQGLPVSIGVLRAEIGWWNTSRVLPHLFWRRLTHNPFDELDSRGPISSRERFTRHQLRPVLLLDDVLRAVLRLSDEQVMSILRAVVGASGARFIAKTVGVPKPSVWATMTEDERQVLAAQGLSSFLNAETVKVEDSGTSFGFDVTFCHFVALCQRLNRPALAAVFCGADEVLFGDPRYEVILTRQTTLAKGGQRCTFRFDWNTDRTSGDSS